MTDNPGYADQERPALRMCFFVGMRLPPPWFVPIEAPACGQVLDIPAEHTNDNTARRFVCDDQAGHDGKHRAVTDNEQGLTLEWNPPLEGPDLDALGAVLP